MGVPKKSKKNEVHPVAAAVLLIICALFGAGLGAALSTTVAHAGQVPVVITYFYSSPSTIDYGQSSVVYWGSWNADYCAFWGSAPDVGGGVQYVVPPAGAWSTSPKSNSVYYVACVNTGPHNSGHSGTVGTWVYVTPPPSVPCFSGPNACGQTTSGFSVGAGACNAATPDNSRCPAPSITPSSSGFVAQPSTIGAPQSVMLSWDIRNATECAVTGTNGFSYKNGKASDSVPTDILHSTTSFTLSCQDGAGGPTATFSVKVVPTPNYKEI